MGIIFDLDQTLIDSSIAKKFRDMELWDEAHKLIPNFKLYPDVQELMIDLKRLGIKICIVTISPKIYTKKVIRYWRIPCDYMVCCDDTLETKPNPEPIFKGIEKLNEIPEKILSFGDRDIDIIASKKAQVKSVACLWGCNDIKSLLDAKPEYILKKPSEMKEFILNFYNLPQ